MSKSGKYKVLKIIAKVLLAILLIAVALVVGLFTYVNLKKDQIAKRSLTYLNEEIAGSIKIDNIHIVSLFSFPDIAIQLEGIHVLQPSRLNNTNPVISIPELDVQANLNDILNNTFEIDHVHIRGGYLVINRDSLGNTNISNAFYSQPLPDSLRTDSSTFYLGIDSITIDDFAFRYQDENSGRRLPLTIHNLTGNLTYENSEIGGSADMHSMIDTLYVSDSLAWDDVPFLFDGTYKVELRERLVGVKSESGSIEETPFFVDLMYDYGEVDNMKLVFNSRGQGIPIREDHFSADSIAKDEPIRLIGNMTFETTTTWRSNPAKSFIENLNLKLDIHGKQLKITGIDIDKFIEKFKRSQNFNMLDVSAVLLAGPFGLAVTKGADYTVLALGKAGDSCLVRHFESSWILQKGVLSTSDVALSTENNLISLNGWYNLNQEKLDFDFNLVDRHGCSLMTQRYSGSASDPEAGRVKIIKTFLGPVKNLFRNIGLSNCDIVYSGKVEHPEVTTKREKKEAKERKKADKKAKKQEKRS